MNLAILISLALLGQVAAAPRYSAELVFPLHEQHNHAPGIVECPNGDLMVSWYRGSGERSADDVAVYGARQKHGETAWSEAFLMADTPDFPDCNTCMMVDRHNRLWLFWPTIIANSWESCLTNYRTSTDFTGPGSPKWEQSGLVLLKPADFSAEAGALLDKLVEKYQLLMNDEMREEIAEGRKKLQDKLYQRLGWQPRCKPTVLPSGRILLPLYSDTFSISIMAVSDDDGKTWYASKPLLGFGAIQPAVLRRESGELVAYMRENGIEQRIRAATSQDDGLTWGPVYATDLPNPGSGLDGVRLANGHWLLVYNDTTEGRNSLAVSISDDEGKTWKWTRHLEKQPTGSYHYPAVIQGRDGTIHAVYSYFVDGVDGGKSMKHAAFNEAWVQGEAVAEVPPAPPGYASEDEVKGAFFAGKLKPIDLKIAVPETVSVEKDIEYGKGGIASLKLDLYTPKNRTKPLPAVIFIHGGAWRSGSRDVYHYYCTKFAEHGYIAATISYRLSDVAPFPAAVEDVKCAVRWLRANAKRLGIDPNKIAVAGGSAGGHLSMMIGYAPDTAELEGKGGNPDVSSRVQAVVDLYGPTDLTTDFAKVKGEVIKFLGDKTLDQAPEMYRLASPINHVTKDDPPTLILHGSIDDIVPIEQADFLATKLEETGLAFEYDRVEGWPHTMDLEQGVNRHCLAKMFEFLDKHLGVPAEGSNGR
ncbi:MAG: exo-alpha-sialidase [Planctomycetes bacterium]|nr:exo-alpha-sialidase [Planctomycetota bacterium]